MALSLLEIQSAKTRIDRYTNVTPIMTSRSINAMCGGRQLFFKCEHLQKVGAFKIRGALNALMKCQERRAVEGGALRAVVTHSSGNHAQAVALAGKLLGVEAHIVMPRTSPAVKRSAVEETYGATVYLCEPTLPAREVAAQEVVRRTGGAFIHPYNDRDVQAGQGTAGLEFMMQMRHNLDAVVIAVGGGGMFTGMASAIKALNPTIKVFGAEPAQADDAARSISAGERRGHVDGPPRSIADGLLTTLSQSTFEGISQLCDGIITVSENEIAYALKLIMERMKQVVEPSAAVPLAALLSPRFPKDPKLEKIGVVLCGGNIDLKHMPRYLEMAAVHEETMKGQAKL